MKKILLILFSAMTQDQDADQDLPLDEFTYCLNGPRQELTIQRMNAILLNIANS
tara:strand:+ start:2172 stop:2333 length:162 start_codon:yes stop_codon:yes gene_type:complete